MCVVTGVSGGRSFGAHEHDSVSGAREREAKDGSSSPRKAKSPRKKGSKDKKANPFEEEDDDKAEGAKKSSKASERPSN